MPDCRTHDSTIADPLTDVLPTTGCCSLPLVAGLRRRLLAAAAAAAVAAAARRRRSAAAGAGARGGVCCVARPRPLASRRSCSTPSPASPSVGGVLMITQQQPGPRGPVVRPGRPEHVRAVPAAGGAVPDGRDDHHLRRGHHRHVPVRHHARPAGGPVRTPTTARASRSWPPSPASSCSARCCCVLQQTYDTRDARRPARRSCEQLAHGETPRTTSTASSASREQSPRTTATAAEFVDDADARDPLDAMQARSTRPAQILARRSDARRSCKQSLDELDDAGRDGEPIGREPAAAGRELATLSPGSRHAGPTAAGSRQRCRPTTSPAWAGRCSPTTCLPSSWPARCCWSPPSAPSPSPAGARRACDEPRRRSTTTWSSAPSCSPWA